MSLFRRSLLLTIVETELPATDGLVFGYTSIYGASEYYLTEKTEYLTSDNITYYQYNYDTYSFSEVTGLVDGNSVIGYYQKVAITGGDYTYWGVIGYTGESTSVNIPSIINSLSITKISANAFKYNTTVVSISAPNTLDCIGASAFEGCTNLITINIPNGVTTIGISAFKNCSLISNITIPSSVTELADYLFNGCSHLSTINLPIGIKIIGKEILDGTAYYNSAINWSSNLLKIRTYIIAARSSITIATIDTDITVCASELYSHCSLTAINFNAIYCNNFSTNNGIFQYYTSGREGTVYPDTTLTIGNQVTHLPSYFFVSGRYIEASGGGYCSGGIKFSSTFIIPSNITSIGSYAFTGSMSPDFKDTSASPLIIPSTITTLEDYSFADNIKHDSNELNYISVQTSAYCNSMFENLTLADGNILEVSFGPAVTHIGAKAFYKQVVNLTSLTIPANIVAIGNLAFANTSGSMDLTSITFNHTISDNITLPTAGSSTGMLYVKTSRNMTVYHNGNTTVTEYAYSTDNITATLTSL